MLKYLFNGSESRFWGQREQNGHICVGEQLVQPQRERQRAGPRVLQRGCPQGAERGKEICGSLSLIIFMFSCLITTCQLSVGRNDVLQPLVWEFIVINGPGGND